MFRTTKKFLPLKFHDILFFYYFKFESKLKKNMYLNKRNTYLNKLNFFLYKKVHQGKFIVKFKSTIFHIGYKISQFTKTRKPFFFRSKKKK